MPGLNKNQSTNGKKSDMVREVKYGFIQFVEVRRMRRRNFWSVKMKPEGPLASTSILRLRLLSRP